MAALPASHAKGQAWERRLPAAQAARATRVKTVFAVIKTGGKQYKAAVNDTITVMTLPGEPGETLTFDNVLMVAGDGEPALGSTIAGSSSVSAEIVEQIRGLKVLSFKKRRRKNSKRKRGHRQGLTVVRITGISGAGA